MYVVRRSTHMQKPHPTISFVYVYTYVSNLVASLSAHTRISLSLSLSLSPLSLSPLSLLSLLSLFSLLSFSLSLRATSFSAPPTLTAPAGSQRSMAPRARRSYGTARTRSRTCKSSTIATRR